MNIQIIAEIGVNHNGDLGLAKKLVDAAIASGATAVKFQTFKAETLADKNTPKVKYQQSTTDIKESHYEMLKKLELSADQHYELFAYCAKKNIEFISTPYDPESVKFLDKLGVKQFKTASADLIDLDLHQTIAATGKPVLIAVGMATFEEIEEALSFYVQTKNKITLLHCVSNYPCQEASLNLSVLPILKEKFKCDIGYSDHSSYPMAAFLSIGLGATVVEKHFTLDKNLPGPDHKASSTPEEFSELVNYIRRAELILGNPVKKCQIEENEMAKVSRKSLTFAKNIKKGEIITMAHLTNMRPGTGLKPIYKSKVVGRKINRDFIAGQQPGLQDIE